MHTKLKDNEKLSRCAKTWDYNAIPNQKKVLSRYDISERELSVLKLISEGYTNAEIAEQIFLSKRTVEGHRQRLIEKTQAKNTAGLIKFGFHNMLLH